MFGKQFWIGVAVIVCMFQCTNWIAAANGGLQDNAGVQLSYVGSLIALSLGYLCFVNTLSDFGTVKECHFAAMVWIGMIWITIMSFNAFYDLYRDGISLPLGFGHILCLMTCLFVVKKFLLKTIKQ